MANVISINGNDSNKIYDLFEQSIQINCQLQYKGKKGVCVCVF